MKLIPESDCPELQREETSRVWYYRKHVRGRGAFFKSTRESKSKAKAKAIGLKMFAEWLGTDESLQRARFLFDDIAGQVISLKSIKSPKTQVSARLHIYKHLMPFFGGYPIERINEALWEEYIVCEHKKNPNRRLFNDRKHLIMIMRHAYKKGLIKRQLEFRNPDSRDLVGREYNETEIEGLLVNANPDLQLQIMMGFMNGMRRSEILKLEWDRVDLTGGYIHLRKEDTKIRRARTFPMHPHIHSLLVDRFKMANSLFVFPSPHNSTKSVLDNKTAWFACKRKAGIKGRFHDLVHTFMSWGIYKYNLPLTALCAIAGKSIVVAEKRYIHSRASNLKQTIEAFRGILWNEIREVNNNDELR